MPAVVLTSTSLKVFVVICTAECSVIPLYRSSLASLALQLTYAGPICALGFVSAEDELHGHVQLD